MPAGDSQLGTAPEGGGKSKSSEGFYKIALSRRF